MLDVHTCNKNISESVFFCYMNDSLTKDVMKVKNSQFFKKSNVSYIIFSLNSDQTQDKTHLKSFTATLCGWVHIVLSKFF